MHLWNKQSEVEDNYLKDTYGTFVEWISGALQERYSIFLNGLKKMGTCFLIKYILLF